MLDSLELLSLAGNTVSRARFCDARTSPANALVIRRKRVSHVRAVVRSPLPKCWIFLFFFFPVREALGGREYQKISKS